MTKQGLYANVVLMALLVAAIGIGWLGVIVYGEALGLAEPARSRLAASANDFVPLVIAVPAGWLAYCFQRRLSYLGALQRHWNNLVGAVQAAIYYTRLSQPTEAEWLSVLRSLSEVIDEMRGVFRNVGEAKKGRKGKGHYPFESLKEIYERIERLGFGAAATPEAAKAAGEAVKDLWAKARAPLLREFDRPAPTWSDIRG